MRILLPFFCCMMFNSLRSQEVNIIDFEVLDNDTIFFSDLPEVEILEFKDINERDVYFLLKKRVLKVYPYALVAKKKLFEIEIALDTIPRRRKKKRYTRAVTRWVKEEYSSRLKKLTMNEGKLLVKLIYRETNLTSYEILKSYRGAFNAFLWQTMARLWDNNLKSDYDPKNNREDILIEHIITQAKLEGKFHY